MKKLIYIGIALLILLGLSYFTRPGTLLNDYLNNLGRPSSKRDTAEIAKHKMPGLFSLEVRSDVDKADGQAFREGFKIMDFYLKKWFGQSLTRQISVEVDGSAGDNKMLEENGVIKIFFHTQGEEWQLVKNNIKKYKMDDRKRIAAHEYVHLFQFSRGCVRPLRTGEKSKWFLEGSAEWLSYKAFGESGNLPPFFNLEQWMSFPLKQLGSSLQPLKVYEGEGRTENVYPYFNLAVNFLMKDRDIKKIEDLCINLGKEQDFPTAFQNAFDMPLEKFYSDFEKYYQNLIK